MKLLVLGVNHETAPVSVREKIAFPPERQVTAHEELHAQSLVKESIILSTCNRTELYCILPEYDPNALTQWLHQHFALRDNEISEFLYQYHEVDAVKHMMRVASGLNSLVLGEPQILGQVKDAYHAAKSENAVHQTLNNLLQHIFKTAKQVRTDTSIGSSPVSVAFSAVALSKQFFGDLSEQTVMILGAGETGELVARHLKESHIGKIIIANRTLSKAHTLAEDLGGYAIGLNEIDNHLHEADMLIASTGSPDTILSKSQIKRAIKKRRHRPMFMVDIAVPRDIDPETAELDNVYLYTVDDLQEIIEENKRSRQDAAKEAEDIIDTQAHHFFQKYQAAQQIGPLIQDFRKHACGLKDLALENALQQIANGDDPKEVMTKFANQLTNKLLHTPTQNLNLLGLQGTSDDIAVAKKLLLPEEALQKSDSSH